MRMAPATMARRAHVPSVSPNMRAMCMDVNRFLVRASTAGIKSPVAREAMAARIGLSTRVEPIENHKINLKGDYITLGETRTSYAIVHNPRTGAANTRRMGTTILLPRRVIEDINRVSQARASGRVAELKPASRELLLHEGTHAKRAIFGVSRAEGMRLRGAWEREPKQMKRDLEVVFGKKAANGMLKAYPTAQVEGLLADVNEERMADEAAIRGESLRLLRRSGARAITSPQAYMRAVESSARVVLKGRPKPYQRAVLADINMMEARMKGMKFQRPKGPGPVERLAGKIEQFSSEFVSGIGGAVPYSFTNTVRAGGPVKIMGQRAA